MAKRLALLSVLLMAVAGCGEAAAPETETFTQGGVSMEPTVKAGQVVTARHVDGDYEPRHGDIVLFRATGAGWRERDAVYLKRIIAVGGETVACCDGAGKVTVDGEPLDEPYVVKDAPLDESTTCATRRFAPVTVAGDAVFVAGDNRGASGDSRCAGPVPASGVFAVMVG